MILREESILEKRGDLIYLSLSLEHPMSGMGVWRFAEAGFGLIHGIGWRSEKNSGIG